MKRLLSTLLLALYGSAQAAQAIESMTAHFFEVGQAHSTLLEFPCGAMLVDAGAQDERTQKALIRYLSDFFAARGDLHNTIELVLVTHNHIDHDRALPDVIKNFRVKRVLHDGIVSGPGGPPILKLLAAAKARTSTIQVRTILDSAVRAGGNRDGLTDDFIDPFTCAGTSPQIRVLSGRLTANPGWSPADFANVNNHSLVTRIDFGLASFMFMGDAEDPLDTRLFAYYGASSKILDADVLQVGHHGAVNGTSPELVAAISPLIAVLPVGHWSWGRPSTPFTTYQYGHPRQEALDALAAGMTRERSEAVEVMVGARGRSFHKMTISKAIYATDWDGSLSVTGSSDGKYMVKRSHID